MDLLYPPGPQRVPAKLACATLQYRLHTWLALVGLLLFMGGYFLLAGWFGWTAYALLSGMLSGSDDWVSLMLVGTGAAFLAAFMLKALVFVKRAGGSQGIEVSPQEEPALFAFLHRLADDVGAPRPHRVYLSGDVNAGVFYDLSIVNLLIPFRKNLEIGLALVNVLNLGELKAVLAHEFGHFAQRTMAVGRWVYIAQQIAAHIVARRDAFDAFLVRLSRLDLRIAWIGWLLCLIVWSIRSLVDCFFRIVVLAQRALAREMELQADRVAVSMSGSDALVHALYRLGAADQAWDRAVDFGRAELKAGRPVKDLFAVQTRIIASLRTVLADPSYGGVPPIPVSHPESHRLFKAAIAAPPRMWSTHPSSADREAHAKRTYVAAPIDERSAWVLFADPQRLRETLSAHLRGQSPGPSVPIEETLARVDGEYRRAYLDPAYRGIYLGRSIVRHARRVEELYGPLPAKEELLAQLASLYPESLSGDIEQLRGLEEEKGLLVALRAGFLTAPGGVILHRGAEIPRKALPRVIDSVQKEVDACGSLLREHDRRCRTVHLAAAATLGEDWAAYLKGLLQLLHYADHVEANLLDARDLLADTLSTATAGARVSAEQRRRVLQAAEAAYAALRDIHQAVPGVLPDRTVLRRMSRESWRDALEVLRLPAPTSAPLGEWLNAVEGWIRSTASSLAALRHAALEQLLLTEAQVARFARQGLKPGAAPPASQVPGEYRVLLPGTERPRQKLGWWERLQTQSGMLPLLIRSVAAAAIVGLALLLGSSVGHSWVYVVNGLGRPIVVHLGGRTIRVPRFTYRKVDVGHDRHLHLSAMTTDGRPIEQLDVDIGWAAREVYNVASAAALVSWQAAYGASSPRPARFLGAPRWSVAHAEILFEQPPRQIRSQWDGDTRDVLTALAGEPPAAVLAALPDQRARRAVLAAHLRWDAEDSRYVEFWVGAAAAMLPDVAQILRQRVEDSPRDTFNLRLEQALTTGAEHEVVCERQRRMAAASPDSPDLQYLAARCIEDLAQQDRAFLALHQRWPQNPWLALGAGTALAGEARWRQALPLIDAARAELPGMAEQLTVMLARIRRVVAGPGGADLADLRGHSQLLDALLAAESPEASRAGISHAYALLAQGDLGGALLSSGSGEDHDRMLRLVAASDGASAAQVRQALTLPPGVGLDADTVLPTLALAAREGRTLGPLRQLAARLLAPDAARVLRVFSLLRARARRAHVEAAMRGLDPEERGHLYVAAAILRGSACPAAWRLGAKRLLFASERPYLR